MTVLGLAERLGNVSEACDRLLRVERGFQMHGQVKVIATFDPTHRDRDLAPSLSSFSPSVPPMVS